MDYINKFTDNLQQVISVAEEAARVYGSSYIGSEHIVFAMLNCPDCTACKILTSCGVSEPRYREYFARVIDKNSNIKGYTPRTKHMIERALELSVDINGDSSLAGTEHMLLAVMSSNECLAMRILYALGVNMSTLAGKLELAKLAKELNYDAVHDTVHEMAKDEARHGKGFEGLLKRYFK